MEYITDLKGKQLMPGLYARLLHSSNMTLSFVDIDKGSNMPIHQHPHEQITFVMEGELEMNIGGETMVLTPGTVHIIPGNTPHGALALTDVKVLDVFNPVREDYIVK